MKVGPKDFYGAIKEALRQELKLAGFKPAGASLGWAKPTTAGFLSLWFQCDKWGWDPDWGDSFTVEFQTAEEPRQGWLGAKRKRIGHLLEGFPELEEIRLMDNEIISRLPGTLCNKIETLPCGDGEIVVKGVRIDPEPAIYGRDIWLRYYSMDDVAIWSEYFRRNVLRFVDMFEKNVLSDVGKANARFHQMMGRVQSVSSREEKKRIIEEFTRVEPDSHYGKLALKWLDPEFWKVSNVG